MAFPWTIARCDGWHDAGTHDPSRGVSVGRGAAPPWLRGWGRLALTQVATDATAGMPGARMASLEGQTYAARAVAPRSTCAVEVSEGRPAIWSYPNIRRACPSEPACSAVCDVRQGAPFMPRQPSGVPWRHSTTRLTSCRNTPPQDRTGGRGREVAWKRPRPRTATMPGRFPGRRPWWQPLVRWGLGITTGARRAAHAVGATHPDARR